MTGLAFLLGIVGFMLWACRHVTVRARWDADEQQAGWAGRLLAELRAAGRAVSP
jgi:hypothetical protein